MRAVIALVFFASACRIGFSELSAPADGEAQLPDAAPPTPGTVRVTVTGEEGDPAAGQPIAGAHVVVIEASGAMNESATGADGKATVTIAGLSTVVVAHDSASGWQVYSFTGLNGDVDLAAGGRAMTNSGSNTMSVTLPAFTDMAITDSRIRGPASCFPSTPVSSPGTTATFSYSAWCEGKTVTLWAQGLEGGSPSAQLAVGQVTLQASSTFVASGAWKGQNKYDVLFQQVPADVDEMYGWLAMPLGSDPADPTTFDDDDESIDTSGTIVALYAPDVVPGTRVVEEFDRGDWTFSAVYEQVDTLPGNRMFDNTNLPPFVTQPEIDTEGHSVSFAMTNGGTADVIALQTVLHRGTVSITWTAYGPASTTQFVYPTLPADLAAISADAATWQPATLVAVSLPTETYASVLPILDRDLPWWAQSGAYLPAGPLAIAFAIPHGSLRVAPAPSAIYRSPRRRSDGSR